MAPMISLQITQELVKKIDETITVVNKTLDKLTDDQMTNEYPILVFEQKTSTEYFSSVSKYSTLNPLFIQLLASSIFFHSPSS